MTRWSAVVAPHAVVTIENPNGSITIRRARGTAASLQADAEAPLWRDLDAVDVRALAHGDDVELCTVVPDIGAPCRDARQNGDAMRRAAAVSEYRIDEILSVPPGVHVVARGIRGDVFVADDVADVTIAALAPQAALR
jgi:hypothetical protein